MVRNLLLSLFALLVADLLLAQVGKQFVGGWTPLPPASYRIQSSIYHHDLAPLIDAAAAWGPRRHILHTNSLGFKDATARKVTALTSHRRVLLIGDSFTEGVGFPYESTFAGRIASALNSENTEVLNAAVVSYSPTIYYRKVKYLVEEKRLHLDEVVVFLDISDIADEALFYDLDHDESVIFHMEGAPDWAQALFRFNAADPGPNRTLRSTVRNNSVVAHLASDLRVRRQRSRFETDADGELRLPLVDRPRATWTYDASVMQDYGERGLKRAAERMRQLKGVLDGHGIDMTVVVYPWPDQVLYDRADSKHVEYWRMWCARNDVRFMDLFPPFFPLAGETSEDALRRYFLPGDVHFSAVGHATMAEAFLASYGPHQI